MILALQQPPALFTVLAVYIVSIYALLIWQCHSIIVLNYVLLIVCVFCISWMFAATTVIFKTVWLLEFLNLFAAFFFALIVYFITVTEFSVGGPFWFGTLFMVGIEYMLQKKYGKPWDNIFVGIIVAIFMYSRLSLTRMVVRNLNKRYRLNEDDYL